MAEPKLRFADVLGELADRHRQDLGSSSLEELSAFVDGELDEEAADRLRERLALSPEDARTVLQLRCLAGEGQEAELSDEQLEEDLAKACLRLAEEDEARDHTVTQARDSDVEPVVVHLRRPMRQWLWEAAKAAGWVLAIGVGLWHLRAQQQLQPLTQPDADFQEVVLWPEDRERTRGISEEIGEGSDRSLQHLLFEITSESFLEPESFELEILEIGAGAEREIWRTTQVKQTDGGGFRLLVPRRFFHHGTYRIVVWGFLDGKREEMANYRFTLEGP